MSQVENTIFMLRGVSEKDTAMTVQLLKFINETPELKKLVKIVPKMITADQLRDSRVQDALRRKKITAFPALKTPNHIYLGLGRIIDVYKESLYQYEMWKRQTSKPNGATSAAEPEDMYRQFVSPSMSFSAAKDTDDEAMVGNIDENKNMMSKMHEMMRKRQARQGGSKPATQWTPEPPAPGQQAPAPPVSPQEPDGSITSSMIDRAYEGSSSDEPHIDALMKQFYENQQDSI